MKRSFQAGLSVMTAVSLLTLPSLTETSAAASNIHVKIDGVEKQFDVAPYLKNNRTLVPMRGVMETLGAKLTWDGDAQTVTAVMGDTTIVLTIGKHFAKINGQDLYLDAPAELTDGRTMVPLRFLSEALGADVQWDAATSTALIASGKYPVGKRQELALQMNDVIPTLDPSKSFSSVSMDILAQTNEGLVRLDSQGHAVAGVAKSWDVSTDGLTYTFHLRNDAKWADGSQVTAQDFEYSWKRTLDPRTFSQYAFLLTWIKGGKNFIASDGMGDADEVQVKAVDDLTLKVTLENPVPFFAEQTAFPVFFPEKKSFVEAKGDRFGAEADAVLSNGPFKLTNWTHEQSATLEKNLNYWDQKAVSLAKVNYFVVKDSNASVNLFETGQLDRIPLFGPQNDQYRDSKLYSTVNDLTLSYLNYSQKQKVLTNAKVRQALTYAVEAQALTDAVYTVGKAATGFVPDGTSAGASGDFRKLQGDLINRQANAAKAKDLLQQGLKELGLTEFPANLHLLVDDAMAGKKVGERVTGDWKRNLGINVAVEAVPFKIRLQRQYAHDFDISYALWGADYNDPMTFLDLFTTGGDFNDVEWSSPEYDALIQKAKSEPDAMKRTQTLGDAEKLLMNQMPVGPVMFRNSPRLTQSYVKGWIDHPFGATYDLKYVSVQGK